MNQNVVVQQPNGDLNIGVTHDQSQLQQQPTTLQEHRINIVSVVTPQSISFNGRILGVFIIMECIYTLVLTAMYTYNFILCMFAFIGFKGIWNRSPNYLKIYAFTKILSSILFTTLAFYYQNYHTLTPAMFDYIVAMMSIRYANEISTQIN